VRPPCVWFVTLPIALTGSELGHAVANLLLGSPTGTGGELFASGGPGAGLVPWVAAAATAVVGLALANRALGTWTSRRTVSALPFACLAPSFFVIQEHLELFLHTGGLPLGAVSEPTFLPGLALQLPIALAAYLVARGLLRVADATQRLLTLRPGPLLPGRPGPSLGRPVDERPLDPCRASRHSGRAPPVGLTALG
jgi:hypothetical protein